MWQTFLKKWDWYYKYFKVWQTLLQNTSDIIKCDSRYEVSRDSVVSTIVLFDEMLVRIQETPDLEGEGRMGVKHK